MTLQKTVTPILIASNSFSLLVFVHVIRLHNPRKQQSAAASKVPLFAILPRVIAPGHFFSLLISLSLSLCLSLSLFLSLSLSLSSCSLSLYFSLSFSLSFSCSLSLSLCLSLLLSLSLSCSLSLCELLPRLSYGPVCLAQKYCLPIPAWVPSLFCSGGRTKLE
jgi:hypothetical protein